MNWVLIGMPGAGKTAVGRELALLTGREFVDTDEVLSSRLGDIVALFRDRGEDVFRAEEEQLCRGIAQREGLIVATGGGTVQCGETAALLKERGKLIFLRATEATLLSRLKGCKDRPLLMGDLKKNLSALMETRLGQYERAADLAVDTDGLSAKAVAKKILEAME